MKRRLIFGFVTIALVVNLFFGARVYSAASGPAQKDSAYSNLELFTVVLERVRKEYVDGTNLSYQKLVYGALKGMINTLDPHSEFLDPEEYKELQSDTEGNFGGLGIVVGMKDNWVTVISPMEDSPGYKAGILSGDRIIKIEGESTETTALTDVVKTLRGEAGTKVNITIYRPSTKITKDFTLTRAVIKVDMVEDINEKKEFPLGPDKIGYIRIIQFGETTGDELEAAIKKLKAQGMQGLVLDLRWNPGGLLDEAVDVCSKFLSRGQPVVSTEGRDVTENYARKATGSDQLKGAPIVILANLESASAAEIVTGCLQDLHRAVVLGERTFGKGSVQSVINLDDGSALKLTTAKYYTPSHKVIHEHGITPDIYVPMSDQQEHDLSVRRTPGGLESLDDTERARVEADSDPQLDRATDLLKGLILYSDHAIGSGKMAAK
ncbi:MAG TPA: S41 family peptidase [Verrucomicrobiae bacterium]|nr:S41 family peptidase [Verrucomicrobiae bacterium]